MTDPEPTPVTEEERARSEEAIAQLRRDLAEAEARPRGPVTSPGKFTEPVGLDAEGRPQPPLTAQERAAADQARRRGAVQDDGDA